MTVRRRLVTGAATMLLLALAAWCVTRGVVVGPTTGGLLTEPVDQTRLSGAWLVGAAAAVTAAALTGLDACSGLRSPRRGPAPGTLVE